MRRRSLLATTTLLLLTTFVGSASAESLDPERVEDPEKAWYDTGFEDVPGSHVFAAEIAWLAATGISTGYEDEDGYVEFRPSQPVLREQMAAFLYRYASEESVDDDGASFSDIATTHPFFDHVEWLAGTGISTGYPDRTFRGTQPVLREQMAAFLWRYAGSPDVPSLPTTSPFRDVPTSHAFYEAIVWLANQGISTGYADGTFRPSQPVLREQMAAFLSRMDLAPFGPYERLLDGWDSPVLSGDGTWVAFASSSDLLDTGSSGRRIYAGNLATGELRQLDASTSGRPQEGFQSAHASITDDGRYVAFASNFSDIVPGVTGTEMYLHDLTTGATTRVPRPATSGPSGVTRGAISGDGSTIAMVVANENSTHTAVRVDLATGTATSLPTSEYIANFVDLSYDGDRIVLSLGSAYLWERGSDTLERLDPNYGTAQISPDGAWVANGREVFALDSDVAYPFQDYVPNLVIGDASSAFSGDSEHLILGGPAGESAGALVRIDLSTQVVESLAQTMDDEPLQGDVAVGAASYDASLVVFSASTRNLMPIHVPDARAVYLWRDPAND